MSFERSKSLPHYLGDYRGATHPGHARKQGRVALGFTTVSDIGWSKAEHEAASPTAAPRHITLCTYLRNKTSKDPQPGQWKKSTPPQINKTKITRNKTIFFFCIFKSRNKERKKNLFLGLKINKHNELGYTYYVTIPTLFFSFFSFF